MRPEHRKLAGLSNEFGIEKNGKLAVAGSDFNVILNRSNGVYHG